MGRNDLAPRYKSSSGWNALLTPRGIRDEVPATRSYSTIVIGAGFTGLAAARTLAELQPEQEVLVIEASVIGEGASGRNSGFLSPFPSQPRATRLDTVDEAARRQIRIIKAGFDYLRGVVKSQAIDCDWDELSPRITAAATARGEENARAAMRRYARWGLVGKEHTSESLKRALGTAYYRFGYEPENKAFVQPAKLIRGLADSLPESVTLLEQTIVLAVNGDGPFTLDTTRGEFRAGRIIVATNANARGLGFLRNRLIGIYTYGALTHELDDAQLAQFGDIPRWGVIPAHRMGTTLRKIGRRILVRSGDSYESEMSYSRTTELLEDLLRNRYPALDQLPFEHVWGGITAVTHNGGQYFGQLRNGLYISAGCNGGGIVRGSIQGKLLAEMALGSQSQLLSDRLVLEGPNWIPSEPFCRMGALASIKVEQLVAGRER